MKFIYPAVFRKNEEGRYKAFFPDLACCEAEGDTLDDAIDNANEAAYNWIYAEVMEDEMDLPAISDESDLDLLEGDINTQHFLKELKRMGIKLALDDFGTGNSSLSLALELPVDELKVDMSFIKDIEHNPQNQAMVQSIVDYANRTNTETCIEGIENQEVSDYIHQFGATWYQGYFYSKPVPIDQFETLLDVPH